eukprot:m.122705 g.122705  ORF g.122705 m.122705 type:complete len:255 (-) comp11118_c0_seq2:1430-2194(-)
MMGDTGPDPAVEAENVIKEWMEQVPFSRKEVVSFKNIARDFSDGLCVAEVIKYYLPKLVELHNYRRASSSKQKLENWKTLNAKVLSKLDVKVPDNVIQKIVDYEPGVMLMVLNNIKIKVEQRSKPKGGKKSQIALKQSPYKSPQKKKAVVLPESTGGDGAIRAAATGPAVWSGKGKRSPKTVVRADSQTQAAGAAADASPTSVEVELLRQCVEDYEDVNTMLLSKVKKLETLLKLKDKRIGNLERLCTKNGLKT